MIIKHPTKHRWIKKIDPAIFPDFGKNNTKKIKSLLETVSKTNITHTFELLKTEHIDWFEKHYHANLATKHNPKPYNVYDTTLGKETIIYPYYILSLFEDNEPIGGTIFTLREDRLSIVYRTYPSNWLHHSYKCSPSLYAEFLITEHALDKHLPHLVHGRDFNPYGVHSHVGVAIFKLSAGCYPDIKTAMTVAESDLDTLPYGSLLLEYPESGSKINRAYLIGDTVTAQKYEQLFKYPKQLSIVLYTPKI